MFLLGPQTPGGVFSQTPLLLVLVPCRGNIYLSKDDFGDLFDVLLNLFGFPWTPVCVCVCVCVFFFLFKSRCYWYSFLEGAKYFAN